MDVLALRGKLKTLKFGRVRCKGRRILSLGRNQKEIKKQSEKWVLGHGLVNGNLGNRTYYDAGFHFGCSPLSITT